MEQKNKGAGEDIFLPEYIQIRRGDDTIKLKPSSIIGIKSIAITDKVSSYRAILINGKELRISEDNYNKLNKLLFPEDTPTPTGDIPITVKVGDLVRILPSAKELLIQRKDWHTPMEMLIGSIMKVDMILPDGTVSNNKWYIPRGGYEIIPPDVQPEDIPTTIEDKSITLTKEQEEDLSSAMDILYGRPDPKETQRLCNKYHLRNVQQVIEAINAMAKPGDTPPSVADKSTKPIGITRYFEINKADNQCITPCPVMEGVFIASMACGECRYRMGRNSLEGYILCSAKWPTEAKPEDTDIIQMSEELKETTKDLEMAMNLHKYGKSLGSYYEDLKYLKNKYATDK